MPQVLGLDISSTATGWALFDCDPDTHAAKLTGFGTLEREGSARNDYPQSYITAADMMADQIFAKVCELHPDVLAIEETNQGKNRYSQKLLEWVHYAFLTRLRRALPEPPRVVYISTSSWHKSLGIAKTKADRDANKKLSQLKSAKARHLGVSAKQVRLSKDEKAVAGLTGKVTTKTLSIRYIEALIPHLGKLKQKQNNETDAMCLALAFINNAPVCDGK